MQEISQTVLMAGFSRSPGSRGYGLHGDSSTAALWWPPIACGGHMCAWLWAQVIMQWLHMVLLTFAATLSSEIKHIYKSQRPFKLRFSAISNQWMRSGFISWCRATVVFNSITHYNPEERSDSREWESSAIPMKNRKWWCIFIYLWKYDFFGALFINSCSCLFD